jgi:hypothetical protein
MKKLGFIFAFCIILTAFFGCEKDDDGDYTKDGSTVVRGTVTEFGTNKPVANALVVLNKAAIGGFFQQGGQFFPVDTFFTDINGKFDFKYKSEGRFTEAIQVQQKGFFDSYIYDNNLQIGSGQINIANVVIKPEAFIRFHIKNVNPAPIGDDLRLSGEWSTGSGDEYEGKYIDTIITRKVFGNSMAKFQFALRRDGKIIVTTDSLFIKGGETKDYKFNY